MRTLLRLLLSVLAAIFLFLAIAYIDGTTLPVEHSVSVVGIVPAAPEKVFARITNVAAGATWRPAVKSVKVLPPVDSRDHWVEDLGHGTSMTFLATYTDAPNRREVRLDAPKASYGGTWIYDLSPGPTPNSTRLRITENGFIHPPLYRFIMTHVFGATHNLDQYMKDIQAAAPTL